MRNSIQISVTCVFVAVALLAIGCSSSMNETSALAKATVGDSVAATRTGIDSSENAGKLIIYSGRGEKLIDPIIEQFSEVTGIEVSVKYAKTPELAATLLEEGINTPADVFFAQDPGGLGAVEDMLAQLPEGVLSRVPDWARSKTKGWVGISGRARTVVYNPDTLQEEDLPDDMWGFVKPEWKGRIGWAPTNASFQTMVTAMRSIWGEEKTKEWILGIQANEPTVYPKNTPQISAVAAGEIDVGFVNHYYLFRFLAEQGDSFSARNYHPRNGGPGSVVMVAGVGILQDAQNGVNALKFVEFMLSRVAQQYFASQTYEYPLVDGVNTSRLLMPFSDIVKPLVTLNQLTDVQGTVNVLRETGVLP